MAESFSNTNDGKNPHNADDSMQLMGMWNYMNKARKGFEIENFINNNYYRNQHYVKYNLQLNKLETVPNTKLGSRISINRVKEKCTQAVAFLTKEEPRFDVQPSGGQETNEETKARIDAERFWSDYQYKRLNIARKTKELALEGSLYSLSWLIAGYDPYVRVPLADGTEIYGDITIDVAPWWHVYWDPMAKDMEHVRFMAFAEQRTIGELQRKYPNAKAIVPNQEVSPSDYEKRILNQMWRYAPSTLAPNDESSTTTLIQLYYFKFVNVKKEVLGEEKTVMERQLWLAKMTKDGLILEHGRFPWGDFLPLEPFQWDAAIESIQTEGLVKQIRQPNKALNTLVTSLVEYSNKFKGKILEPRTSNIVTINDEHGERVQYDLAGGKPEFWQVPPVNPSVNQGIQYLEQKIDDLSMIHSQFAGQSGFSGESGFHAEIIASGDAQNFMTTKNNLNACLEGIFKKALMIAAQEYKKQGVPRSLSVQYGQEEERFEIAGENMNIDDTLTVTTQDNFALTKGYLFDELKQLYQLQVIDKQTLLEAYKFTDVQTILDRLQEQQNGEPVDNQVAMAQLENRMASQGNQIPEPQPGQNHMVHMALHARYLKSPEVATNQRIKQILVEHMQQTEQLMQQEQMQQDQQQQMQQPAETVTGAAQLPPTGPNEQAQAGAPGQQPVQQPQPMPQQVQPQMQPQGGVQ